MVNTINTTQGSRIKLARKAKGLTQTELAERVGLKGHQLIQNYEKDRRGTEHPNLSLLVKIADVTDVSIDWLLTGKDDKDKDNSRNYPHIQNFAPVIDWDEIRTWKTVRNNMNLARREQVPLFGGLGVNCFGLRVKDDSMVSTSNGDVFREGDIVIIDPDIKPDINDYVIVGISENEPLMLRKFTTSSKGAVLKPLNDQYPDSPITEKVIFFGVVVGQHRSFIRK